MIVSFLLNIAYAAIAIYDFHEAGKNFDNGNKAMGMMYLSIGIIFMLFLASYILKIEITNDIENIMLYD